MFVKKYKKMKALRPYTWCIVVPAQVDGGAAEKGYRAVI